jgi:hypothetical protein
MGASKDYDPKTGLLSASMNTIGEQTSPALEESKDPIIKLSQENKSVA